MSEGEPRERGRFSALARLRAGAKELAARVGETKRKADALLSGATAEPADNASERAAEIAGNEPRSQGYQGDDTEQLLELARAEFRTYFPDSKLIGGVVESSDWFRNRTEAWNPSTQQAELRDRSHVILYLFVNEGNGLASQWPLTVTRDHVQGDRLSAHLEVKLREDPLPTKRLFLADKLRT